MDTRSNPTINSSLGVVFTGKYNILLSSPVSVIAYISSVLSDYKMCVTFPTIDLCILITIVIHRTFSYSFHVPTSDRKAWF